MDPVLQLALMFGLGLLAQAVFLVKNDFRKNIRRFLGALAPSIALAAIFIFSILLDDSRKITVNDIYLFLFLSYLLFALSFTGLFFYKALYEINEKILLVWTLIFWYAYAVNFNLFHWASIIFLVPTAIVLIAGFAPAHMDYFWKAFLYGWFLFILVFLVFVQFKSANLNLFLSPKKIAVSYDFLTAISAGMVFLSTMIYGSHLLAFLPIAGKHKRWDDRSKEIREHAINLSGKYSDYQMMFTEALAVLGVIGGIFLFNYHFKVITNDLLINLAIIGSFLYSERPRRRIT